MRDHSGCRWSLAGLVALVLLALPGTGRTYSTHEDEVDGEPINGTLAEVYAAIDE